MLEQKQTSPEPGESMGAVPSGRVPLCLRYRVRAASNTMMLKQWKSKSEPSSKAGKGGGGKQDRN